LVLTINILRWAYLTFKSIILNLCSIYWEIMLESIPETNQY